MLERVLILSDTKHLLIGYVDGRALPTVTPEDARKMTHINIAFGHVKNDAVTVENTQNLDFLPKLREYNPQLEILLSVGGWSAGGFSEAASTAEGRRKFAQTSVEILRARKLDGIDIDWEYPTYGQAGIGASPEDKYTFTLLLEELRNALDEQGQKDGRHYYLTIAAGAGQYFVEGTEMDKAQKYLDWVQLMTYDMRGGFQNTTGHHSNLYTPVGDLNRSSVVDTVRIFTEAGVPKEKLVIGAAFYSRMWKDVPNVNNGMYQMSPANGGYGPVYTDLAANYINKNGFVRYWDDVAKAPWLFDGSTFITYDDPESMAAKCAYLKEAGLLGIMFWEYSCDETHTLLDTLYKALQAK
ncbi:MAG: glycoside hydrolase family 18 protein [Firmicutes bacterium]|nr:glycoside hydrolase family 18 protein [Bacillota bacterium]